MNDWKKKQARSEIISFSPIPNDGNFKLLASHYNLLNQTGLVFQFQSNIEFEKDKIFLKNNFYYFAIEHEGTNHLFIIPNEKIFQLTQKILQQISTCENETDVLNLLIELMECA